MFSSVLSLLLLFQSSPLDDVRSLIRAGETQEALILLTEIKQDDPADASPYILSGWALFEAGRQRDAEVELKEGLQRGPDSVDEAELAARLIRDLGFPSVALEVMTAAAGRLQLSSKGLFLLAELQFSQRQFEPALATLDQLATASSELRGDIDLLRGQIYLQHGKLEEAMTAFEQVVRQDPDHAEGFHGLAETSYRGNNLPAARKMAERAVQLDPNDPLYLHLLGVVLRDSGQYEAAVRHLHRATRLRNVATRSFFDLGQTYRLMGESDRARAALSRYQQIFSREEADSNRSQRVVQLVNQGKQQLESGQIFEAVRSLRRVVDEDPENWEAYSLLAKVYLSSGRIPEAGAAVRRLLEIDPESAETHYLSALYWQAQGDFENALSHAEKGKVLRPSHPDLRNLLGNLYYEVGRKDKALEEYGIAAALAPGRSEFQANYRALSRP